MKYIRVFILLFLPLLTFSQDINSLNSELNCESLLKEAQSMFEAGNYERVIASLEAGLRNCSFSYSDKQRMYVLMIQAQIERENDQATDSMVFRLFKLNPNYRLSDPELVSRYNSAIQKYSVRPAFMIGAQVGFNIPFAHIETVYSILEDADYSRPYNGRAGIIAGLHFEWQFLSRLSLVFDPHFSKISYQRTIPGERSFSLKFSEEMSAYNGSVLIQYTYPHKKFRYSLNAGYCFTNINKSFADIELAYTAYNSITQLYDPYRQAANKIDLMENDLRIRNTGSWLAGASIAYQIQNFIFSVNARYHYSEKNLVNREQRYSNSLLVYDYYYVDNDFDLNRLEITGGISYILFHKISTKSR